jgi:hypothetical protein
MLAAIGPVQGDSRARPCRSSAPVGLFRGVRRRTGVQMDNSSAPIVTLAGASSPLATDRCAVTGEDGRDGVLYLQPVPLLPTEAQVSPAFSCLKRSPASPARKRPAALTGGGPVSQRNRNRPSYSERQAGSIASSMPGTAAAAWDGRRLVTIRGSVRVFPGPSPTLPDSRADSLIQHRVRSRTRAVGRGRLRAAPGQRPTDAVPGDSRSNPRPRSHSLP